MINKHQNLLAWSKSKACTIDCEINLGELFKTKEERIKFNAKWADFINSDPDNKKVYRRKGNPATHSVEAGMFFSFEGNKKEHRFWKNILKPAGVLDLSFDSNQNIAELNKQQRETLFNLKYDSPFHIGLCVIISMPSAPGGKWGGIAGIHKLLGKRALRRLENEETERVLECAKKFVTPKGAVIAFQKNAWNNLRSENDPEYNVKLASIGKLKGHLKGNSKISLLCVPPTRLCGSCSRVLKKLIK